MSGFRLLMNDTATIYRRTRIWNKQNSYNEIWSMKWFFKPVDASNQNVWIELYGKIFHFTTSWNADIQQGDKVVINSVNYSVSWVAYKRWLRVMYTRAILQKEQ